MILTVNVGNTNTKICLFQGRRLVVHHVVATRELLQRPARVVPSGWRITGAAVASVVPQATSSCLQQIRARTGLRPFLVNRRTRTGLDIRYDRNQLGADRICVAVGARVRFPGDLVVIDFGTAVTVNVVTREGVFLGGPILPGQGLMLRSLGQGTARLPRLRARPVTRLLASRTEDAVQAGTFQLLCLGLEAMIRPIEQQAGRRFTVIATGGQARKMRQHIPSIVRVEPDLVARGLLELYFLNRQTEA
ncbi:MAG: type III pantothenate kinase [candidate division WOR-3 bacterium]